MVFSHPFFVYAFLAFLFVAFFVSKKNSTRRGILIAFSLVFYGWGEPVYVFLMILTVGFDYLFGRLIDLYRDPFMKKLWMIMSVGQEPVPCLGNYRLLSRSGGLL